MFFCCVDSSTLSATEEETAIRKELVVKDIKEVSKVKKKEEPNSADYVVREEVKEERQTEDVDNDEGKKGIEEPSTKEDVCEEKKEEPQTTEVTDSRERPADTEDGVAGKKSGSQLVLELEGLDDIDDSAIQEMIREPPSVTRRRSRLLNGPPVPSRNGEMYLSVTVPEGVSSGNTIIVKSPFGARKVETVVPQGVSAGGSFTAYLPPIGLVATSPKQSFLASVDNFFTPSPVVVGIPVAAPFGGAR